MRLLTVVGNRPQFIKSAPLSVALREAGIEEVVVHTGQHWDPALSAVFFEELGLAEPDVALDLRTSDVATIEAALRRGRRRRAARRGARSTATRTRRSRAAGPGDGLPVAHVEAGLRSGDLTMPEERNRIEVDALSALPLRARRALGRDAAQRGRRRRDPRRRRRDGRRRSAVRARSPASAPGSSRTLGLEPGGYVLATVHREANVRPERLRRIVAGLGRSPLPVVLPAHPRTTSVLDGAGDRACRRRSR